jgi:hypothetical protein
MPHGRLPVTQLRPKPGRALRNELARIEAELVADPGVPAGLLPPRVLRRLLLEGAQRALRWSLRPDVRRPSDAVPNSSP